jgi:hypothetical protein
LNPDMTVGEDARSLLEEALRLADAAKRHHQQAVELNALDGQLIAQSHALASEARSMMARIRETGALLTGPVPAGSLSGDASWRENRIEMVRRHVRLGEVHVARQHEVIERLFAHGLSTETAEQFLANLKGLLRHHQQELDAILAQRAAGLRDQDGNIDL